MNQLMLIKSHLKLTKNASHLMLKALFVPEIFSFLSFFLVMYKNALITKLSFILKFMTSQTGQDLITTGISSRLLLFKKALDKVKGSGQHLSFDIFS